MNMKAILIDPFAQTITAIELPKGNWLKEAYKLMHCELVDTVRWHNGIDTILVDDEGLFVPTDDQQYFAVVNNKHEAAVLAGRALLVGGADDEGETLDVSASIEDVKVRIAWMNEGRLREKAVFYASQFQ